MPEESKINTLINVGQSKIAEKAYDDILSDPGKKVGFALGTIINVGNTLLWPIKWANERTRIFFEDNLRKYERKLADIPEDKIIDVPTEISMPILERFTYTSNEELSSAFVNLLACASSIDNINKAHPGFIQIIDRISPDEAHILKYFSAEKFIPALTIRHYEDFNNKQKSDEYVNLLMKVTNLSQNVQLKFPENIAFYLDNLTSLGLIEYHEYYYITCDEGFTKIEETNAEVIDFAFGILTPTDLSKAKKVVKGMFEVSNYGRMFIDACIV